MYPESRDLTAACLKRLRATTQVLARTDFQRKGKNLISLHYNCNDFERNFFDLVVLHPLRLALSC